MTARDWKNTVESWFWSQIYSGSSEWGDGVSIDMFGLGEFSDTSPKDVDSDLVSYEIKTNHGSVMKITGTFDFDRLKFTDLNLDGLAPEDRDKWFEIYNDSVRDQQGRPKEEPNGPN